MLTCLTLQWTFYTRESSPTQHLQARVCSESDFLFFSCISQVFHKVPLHFCQILYFVSFLPLSLLCLLYRFTPLFKSPQGQLTFNSCPLWTFPKCLPQIWTERASMCAWVCWSGLSRGGGRCVSLRTWELYRPSRSVSSTGGDQQSQDILHSSKQHTHTHTHEQASFFNFCFITNYIFYKWLFNVTCQVRKCFIQNLILARWLFFNNVLKFNMFKWLNFKVRGNLIFLS